MATKQEKVSPTDVGVLNRQPINRDMLGQLDFKFLLKRAPHVNFFLQRVNIPGINLPNVFTGTPFVRIPYSGDHIIFAPLSIEFKVDEDFENYFEIHRWLTALGFPHDQDQYAEIANKNQWTGEGIRSDISLLILSSVKKPNIEVVFHECIPTSLSDLVFSTTPPDVDYISALATFSYIWSDVSQI